MNAFTRLHHASCPSDDIQDAYIQVICATQPVMIGRADSDAIGILYWPSHDYSSNFGRTNYAACAGAYSGGRHPDKNRQPFVGVMSSRGRVSLDQVPDGITNTIMFGETIGSISNNTRTRGMSWCYGGLARGRGSFEWNKDPAGTFDAGGRPITMLGNANNSSLVGFGSMHPAGVNMARADGSVELVPRSIDWQVLYSLCGSNDAANEIED